MLNRRKFLAVSGGALSAGVASIGTISLATTEVAGDLGGDETILVALQMAGGNDGLNTVVPYRDDNYRRLRPTLALKESDVIRLQDDLGFHPALKPLMPLWEEGHLAVVQGVGYPQASDDHGRAMEIWQTARPEDPLADTGWLGRAADELFEKGSTSRAAAHAVFLGQIPIPLTVVGRHQPAVRCQQPAELFSLHGGAASLPHYRQLIHEATDGRQTTTHGLLAETVEVQRQTTEHLSRLEKVLGTSDDGKQFPQTNFGRQIACLTRLVRANLGIRIFCLDLGGQGPGTFDTHALQAANHGELLAELAQGLALLADVLKKDGLFDSVAIYTYSEFGRTIRENGRKGTDHGAAAPVFVLGGKVKGGLVGKHPPLDVPEKGGVPHHTDFRSLYATFLDRWLHVPSERVLGRHFGHLPLFA